MSVHLSEILKLSVSERILLVEAIWDSIANETQNVKPYQLTEEQMQFLEEERAFLVENIVLLFQFLGKGDGASLAACNTSIRSVRSNAEATRNATSLCVGQEARYASYIGVIKSIDLNTVISPNQTEAGADTADVFSHSKRA